MPSVGMRRSTRVFGARVLRSGRRLWCGPSELLGNYGDNEVKSRENGWRRDTGLKEKVTVMDIDEKKAEPKKGKNVGRGLVKNKSSEDKMLGFVYQRKRKWLDSKNSHFDGVLEKKGALEDRKYGKQFVRKQSRNKRIGESNSCPVAESSVGRVFSAAVKSSCHGSYWFACVLSMVLRYMRGAKLILLELHAFVSSEPLAHVFSSQGIHFSLDSPSTKNSGICKIYGARQSTPLFAVNFSAVPFCFMYLHSTLALRSLCFPYGLVTYSNVEDDGMTNDVEHHLSCISSERDSSGIEIVTSANDNSGKKNSFHPSIGASKLAGRHLQFRTGVNSRSIQKRRSSRRSRRVKNTSVLRGRKANSALVSNLVSPRCDSIPLVPAASDRQLRSYVRKNSSPNIKFLKSSLVELSQDICSTCCCANILVIESDKCYRIEGAIIKMESSSKQWFLAVTKDGITVYSLTAQKVMRPCSCNRITHDIIWTEDTNSWKLEFPDRRDWLIFKELYKACSDRNVKAPTSNVIPVPRIHEVFGYADCVNSSFSRPNSYISVKDDELSRALAKRVATYDMDSEDEEWLREFNNGSSIENEPREHVSEESFEFIIDAFEKEAFYCSPDDCADEKEAISLCLDVEKKEVVEAVYSYWMKKRKKKCSALLRVFQCYRPRRALLLPKPIIRKKRSFKRQPSHSERSKQRTFMQAMAPKQDALEEQNVLRKVEETKAEASRSEVVAVVKRQKAQLLMENADLAVYKAAMALRIAETARVAESADAVASFFVH
ncbi:Enhancer of polycomb like [Actinidia chinensis var. chinensis]|uniref:Enhancer of polycomb-like protein n=1 Tax=Actinidia chinensis var. chinensis TaxID=1590841 RepID=A0A2R6PYE4_ACTCC|nr:Enhancer of polycomb like [Actinidia chinensis var. chinensis]